MLQPALAKNPDLQTPEQQQASPTAVYFVTALGLFFAFPGLSTLTRGIDSWALSAGLSGRNVWALTSIGAEIARTLTILGIVFYLERRPLASLGLTRPTIRNLGAGLALFAVAEIVNVLYVHTLHAWFPDGMSNIARRQLQYVLTLPIPAMVGLGLAAGFAEEITERGFALDRLRRASGSVGFAAVAVLALSMAAHIPFWGWRYAILIGPSQLLLILAYLWWHNIWPNIVAHSLLDCFPVLSRMVFFMAVSLLGGKSYHVMAGDFRYRHADYTGPIREYSEALNSRPNDPHLLSQRAGAEIMNHDYGPAILDLNIALTRSPGNRQYLSQRASAYFSAGLFPKAKIDADKAVAAAPGDARMYEQRAEIEKWLDQPDKSIADLNQAIRLSKGADPDLYSDRGMAYLTKRNYGQASKDLQLAATLRPGDTDILAALATIDHLKKQYSDEVARFTRLLTLDPDNLSALLSRANAYLWLGQRQAALGDFRAAAKKHRDDAEAVDALSWFLSTCPEPKLRDGHEALELASHACELSDWNQAAYIDTLAAAFAELGDFDEAVTWEQRAIDLEKQSPTGFGKEFEGRLQLYQKRLPYREEQPDS
jgi:tetratricopeptide (TPR) repeat protein/membrane protease YdiL (CAAX protease family)